MNVGSVLRVSYDPEEEGSYNNPIFVKVLHTDTESVVADCAFMNAKMRLFSNGVVRICYYNKQEWEYVGENASHDILN